MFSSIISLRSKGRCDEEAKIGDQLAVMRVFSRRYTHDQLVGLICKHNRSESILDFVRMNDNWSTVFTLAVFRKSVLFETAHWAGGKGESNR